MLNFAERFARTFSVEFTFGNDVPLQVVLNCLKKGWPFAFVQRPKGRSRQHAVCTIPFEGRFGDVAEFRRQQETFLRAPVLRTRILSPLIDDGKKNAGGFVYDEAGFTVAVHDHEVVPSLFAFIMDAPGSGLYRDLRNVRDDDLQTWHIVLRSRDADERLRFARELFPKCERWFLRSAVRGSFRRVHVDSNPSLDNGWMDTSLPKARPATVAE